MGDVIFGSIVFSIVALCVAGISWAAVMDGRQNARQGREDRARLERWARALEGEGGLLDADDRAAATREMVHEYQALNEVLNRHASHAGTRSALRELNTRIENALISQKPTAGEARAIIESVRRVAGSPGTHTPEPTPPALPATAPGAAPDTDDAQVARLTRKAQGIRQIAHTRLGADEMASNRIEGYTATIAESVERNCREIALAREAGAMIEGEHARAELAAFERARRDENERLLDALEEASTRLVKMEHDNGDGAAASAALAALTRALESAPPRAFAPGATEESAQ